MSQPKPDARSPTRLVRVESRSEPRTDSQPGPFGARRDIIGAQFDDFEILSEIGSGSMGVVYKAHQKSLDRVVAIKLLVRAPLEPAASNGPCPGVDSSPGEERTLSRFFAEARAIARLDHPHIVDVHRFGQCAFGHYFAMKFIEGDTLQDLIDRRALSVHRIVKTLVRVALAVQHAHSKGILHRDLKPANVIVDGFRRPVVMDFGIAKFMGRDSTDTEHGVGLGTPAYMPPEQLRGDSAAIGPRSDIFALGGILYTALTGRPPFDAGSVMATVARVDSDAAPSPIQEVFPGVPPTLARIAEKCLAKRPKDRFGSAEELALALKGVLEKHPEELKTLYPPAPAHALRIVEKMSGRSIPIWETSVIGRARDCDIVLDAANVSKRHCEIAVAKGSVVVRDLDSSNGTWVNGHRVHEARLADGDSLRISKHEFAVEVPERREGV